MNSVIRRECVKKLKEALVKLDNCYSGILDKGDKENADVVNDSMTLIEDTVSMLD